ncbi:MAG: enoyl-CoA hydratase [Holosporales bacterium]
MSFETLTVERKSGYALITFNRPKVLNALSSAGMAELTAAVDDLEKDNAVAAIILTGSEKAFAAGADIAEMQAKTWPHTYLEDFITDGWERLASARKPLIAAVSGFALGGGNEVAMMCDIILASDTAKFGQPEISLGIIPGAGGTQRLTRAVGKAKAMEMILTGRMIDAAEAERIGLVSRIVPAAELLAEAEKVAAKIAGFSRPSVLLAKESVNRAFETTLTEGVRFERRAFQSLFATFDQKEGMTAFREKRSPVFKNQ